MHRKLILLVFMSTFLVSMSTAMQFSANLGTQQSFFAECKNASTGLYYSSTANITIYFPNTSIFKNNIPMNNYATGQFVYVHNVSNTTTGVYNANVMCVATSGGAISKGADSYEVRDKEGEVLGAFSVSFVLVVLTVLGFIIAFSFINQDSGNDNSNYSIEEKQQKQQHRAQKRIIGYILLGLPLILIWILNFVLMTSSTSQPYYKVISVVFYFTSIVCLLSILTSVILFMFLVLYMFPSTKKRA